MSVSEYDITYLTEILKGKGNWYSAHVLRFLNIVLWKADLENLRKLWATFPEECEVIYRSYGWTDEQIAERKGRVNAGY